MRRRLAGCLATAQMASCLFPPNLSDGPTNLPLAEDIERRTRRCLGSCCAARRRFASCTSATRRDPASLERPRTPSTRPCLLDGVPRRYLAFRNVKNYAPLAGLVIPKRRRPQDPDGLRKVDVALLEDMRRIALEVCQREQPEAFAANDYWLRFHRRPWHSVDHLHLHVLAPASKVSSWTAFIFLAGSPWSLDADALLEKLRRSRE